MFGQQVIGYAQIVDWEVQDQDGQPPAREATPKSWWSWFGGTDADPADQPAQQTDDLVSRPAGPQPDDRHPVRGQAVRAQTASRPLAHRPLAHRPLTSRPLISGRLAGDPRLRAWIIRVLGTIVAYLAVTAWHGWRFGLSAAVLYACGDIIYRSRTTGIVPPSVRVTSAQRGTRRRLKVLEPAGYLALQARSIPGTDWVIDHLVVGPAGVFALDSVRLDKRLPVLAIGGMLYHGPVSQLNRIDHAKDEARRAAALIGAQLGQRIRVRPAVVLYGPKAPWMIMKLKGVDVFNGQRVGAFFRRQSKATAGHHLDPSQIALVLSAAAHALPPIK
ncbi:MAG TPA: hypothetical protein VNF47_09685 [Streptosporangiaceae bacterium]|nr:hypothetical protein [Streptosporangiaceae bacterium]